MTEILSVVEKILSLFNETDASSVIKLIEEIPFDKILSAFTSLFSLLSNLS